MVWRRQLITGPRPNFQAMGEVWSGGGSLLRALGRIFKLWGKYGLEEAAYYGPSAEFSSYGGSMVWRRQLITGPRPNFQAMGEVWSGGGSLLRALGRIFKLWGKYGLEEAAYYGPSAEFSSYGGSMVWRRQLITGPRPNFQAMGEVWSGGGSLLRALGRIFKLWGKYGLEEAAYYGPSAEFSSYGGSMVWRRQLITGPRPNFQALGEVWSGGGSLLRALGRIFKLWWKYGLEEGAYYGPSAEFSSYGGSMVWRRQLITGPRPNFQAMGEVWSGGGSLLRALGRIFKLWGKYGLEEAAYYGPSAEFSSYGGSMVWRRQLITGPRPNFQAMGEVWSGGGSLLRALGRIFKLWGKYGLEEAAYYGPSAEFSSYGGSMVWRRELITGPRPNFQAMGEVWSGGGSLLRALGRIFKLWGKYGLEEAAYYGPSAEFSSYGGSMVWRRQLITGPRPNFQAMGEVWSGGGSLLRALGRIFKLWGKYGLEEAAYYGPSAEFSSYGGSMVWRRQLITGPRPNFQAMGEVWSGGGSLLRALGRIFKLWGKYGLEEAAYYGPSAEFSSYGGSMVWRRQLITGPRPNFQALGEVWSGGGSLLRALGRIFKLWWKYGLEEGAYYGPSAEFSSYGGSMVWRRQLITGPRPNFQAMGEVWSGGGSLLRALGRIFKLWGKYGLEEAAYYGPSAEFSSYGGSMVWRRQLITGPRPNFQAMGEVWSGGGSLLRALGRIFKLWGKYGLEEAAYYGPSAEFSSYGGSMVWRRQLITGPRPNFQAMGEVWSGGGSLLRALGRIFKLWGKYGLEEAAYYGPSAEFSSYGGSMVWRRQLITGPRPNFQALGEVWSGGGSLLRALGRIFKLWWKYGLEEGAYYGPSAEFSSYGGSMVWRRQLITGPRPNFQAMGEVWSGGGSLLRALGRIFKLWGKYGLEEAAYYGPSAEFSSYGGSMVWRRQLITGPRPNFQAMGEVWSGGGSLLRALGRIFKLWGKYGLEEAAYYGPSAEFSSYGGSMVWRRQLITGPRPNFQALGEVWSGGGSLLRALGRIFKLWWKYGLEEGAYYGPSAEFSSYGGSMVWRRQLITGPRPNFQAMGEVWSGGGSLLRALGRIFKLWGKYGLEEAAYYGPSAEFSSYGGSMVWRRQLITGPRPNFQAMGEVWSGGGSLLRALGRIFKLWGKYGLEEAAYYGPSAEFSSYGGSMVWRRQLITGPRPNFQALGEVWSGGGSLLRALGRIFKLWWKYGLEEGAYYGPSAEFSSYGGSMVWRRQLITGPRPNFQAMGEVWSGGGSLLRALGRIFKLWGKYGLEEAAYYGPSAEFSSYGGSMVWRRQLITGPRPNFQAMGEVWSGGGSLLRALGRIFKLWGKYGLEEAAYYGPSAEFSSYGGSMVWRRQLITGPRPNFQAMGEVWSGGGSLLRALGRIFKLWGKYGLEEAAYYGPSAEFSSSGGSMVWRRQLITGPRPNFQAMVEVWSGGGSLLRALGRIFKLWGKYGLEEAAYYGPSAEFSSYGGSMVWRRQLITGPRPNFQALGEVWSGGGSLLRALGRIFKLWWKYGLEEGAYYGPSAEFSSYGGSMVWRRQLITGPRPNFQA